MIGSPPDGGVQRGGRLFNRKSTEFTQLLHKLEERLSTLERERGAEKSRNDRNLLEFAELGEKMRRTYLRLSRIVKIDSEASSADEPIAQNEHEPESDPRSVREAIESQMNL